MQCVSRSDKLIHWLIKTDVFFASAQELIGESPKIPIT